MTNAEGNFIPFNTRMQAEGLPEIVIRTFEFYYNQLAEGEKGLIQESDIDPAAELPDTTGLSEDMVAAGRSALPKAILLKLNGGLGTSMGLTKAKSLLKIKNGLTFLDIIAKQAIHSSIPLVLMDSYSTSEDSLAALSKYEKLQGEIPLDFLQHKVPKVVCDDLSPAVNATDPDLTWCPPGHGDIYTALITSGMLETLLAKGYRYAFVSNADNLGAVIDPAILGYFATNNLPFMMEVADRTEADKKGGHLAQLPGGQLLLRESAQCPAEDEATFQDITLHRFFNTNNLWINLPTLKKLMDERGNILGLSMICNKKTVDPREKTSTPVFQLETAMGSAIAVFDGAGAMRIPKTRFAPIKTTNDLLDVRSDNYIMTDDFQVKANPERTLERAFIDLDTDFYKFVDDFEVRFPDGPPSMVQCERLVVRGDILFEKGVIFKGNVNMINGTGLQVVVSSGTTITGNWEA